MSSVATGAGGGGEDKPKYDDVGKNSAGRLAHFFSGDKNFNTLKMLIDLFPQKKVWKENVITLSFEWPYSHISAHHDELEGDIQELHDDDVQNSVVFRFNDSTSRTIQLSFVRSQGLLEKLNEAYNNADILRNQTVEAAHLQVPPAESPAGTVIGTASETSLGPPHHYDSLLTFLNEAQDRLGSFHSRIESTTNTSVEKQVLNLSRSRGDGLRGGDIVRTTKEVISLADKPHLRFDHDYNRLIAAIDKTRQELAIARRLKNNQAPQLTLLETLSELGVILHGEETYLGKIANRPHKAVADDPDKEWPGLTEALTWLDSFYQAVESAKAATQGRLLAQQKGKSSAATPGDL
ncbi:MAG: hypothetical protein SFX19_08795 [Alphaproteobacteria bacterium]|nr:hypothetical protein [Alphaproteobacteria bacterium]